MYIWTVYIFKLNFFLLFAALPRRSKEGKVFHGQEPPSGESTTTECRVNYQLHAVITEVAEWGTPSCSRPQPATNNASGKVDPIDWSHPQTLMGSTPERLVHSITPCSLATAGIRFATLQPSACEATTFPMRPLRGHSCQWGHSIISNWL